MSDTQPTLATIAQCQPTNFEARESLATLGLSEGELGSIRQMLLYQGYGRDSREHEHIGGRFKGLMNCHCEKCIYEAANHVATLLVHGCDIRTVKNPIANAAISMIAEIALAAAGVFADHANDSFRGLGLMEASKARQIAISIVRKSRRAIMTLADRLHANCALPNSARSSQESIRSFLVKFDHNNLHPGLPGLRFNSSIIPWNDGYTIAWRNGWRDCDIFVSLLDSQFRVNQADPIKLNLRHAEASFGREDPRLFMFNGQLHISYIGVVPNARNPEIHGLTRQMYARLNSQLQVEDIFALPKFQQYEKNWQFFEHNHELYAVYYFSHHRILRIDGERAGEVYQSDAVVPWSMGSEIRGGASPMLMGNEWWCFFHASRPETVMSYPNGLCSFEKNSYHMGLYTFEDKPPFRIKRIIPRPILKADENPERQNHNVVFPCGSLRRGEEWIVSIGKHDRCIELHRWSHEELNGALVAI